MKILSIETSCDETSIAIIDFKGSKKYPKIKILSHIISSQEKLHAKFGGVVPNLAKREHQKNLVPILLKSLKETKLLNLNSEKQNSKQALNPKSQNIEKILEHEQELLKYIKKNILLIRPPKIDAIAVTSGPGLEPALWVGINFAKTLAFLWKKPLIPVNHMEGHIFSAIIKSHKKTEGGVSTFTISRLQYPAIALLVSGGHTELVLFKKLGKYKIIGETLDDAAGESFDKVARILGMGYPGGLRISKEAEIIPKASADIKIKFPRPMLNSKDPNFSFSGLKTAVLYKVQDLQKKYPLAVIRAPVAKEFQNAAIEVLVKKTIKAVKIHKAKTVIVGGGVSANKKLRADLKNTLSEQFPDADYLPARPELSGDNALIIGLAAYFTGKKTPAKKIAADGNLRLS